MILTRTPVRGHPSYAVWQKWSDLVNKNIGIFTIRDDFDSICEKLYNLRTQSRIKYISGDSVIRTAAQIADYFGIQPDIN